MTETVSDWLVVALEVLLAGFFIWVFTESLITSNNYGEAIVEQQYIAAEISEYREHNQFDDTLVYSQDIVSAIFKSRGNPAIYVVSSKGSYSWTGPTVADGAACEYNTASVQALLDTTVMYKSRIMYGGNGEVIGYEFIAQ